METILIATDFSNAARNATRYGFEFAKTIHAKVILFNAWQIPAAHPESLVYFPVNDIEKLTYQQLAAEAETIDPFKRVALQTQCRQSPVIDSILSVANENNVSFIIIGMKGHGKEVRKYLGSTVTFLKKQSAVPVIVVPEEAAYSVPATIAFASDITYETNSHIIDPLKKIVTACRSKLFVIHVIKKSVEDIQERLRKNPGINAALANLQPVYAFPSGSNVAKAINDFVKENAVKMIAVIPHEHDLIQKIFTRSVTKDLVFHAHVPLLILPAPAAEKTGIENEALENIMPEAI